MQLTQTHDDGIYRASIPSRGKNGITMYFHYTLNHSINANTMITRCSVEAAEY